MSLPSHMGEQLQDLLDGRLDDANRAGAEAHLESCAQCRREFEALRWIKIEALGRLRDEQVPASLVSRVRASLDAEDARIRRAAARPRPVRSFRWVAAIGLLGAAAAVLFVVSRPSQRDLPALVARDFNAFAEGRLSLGVAASEPRTVTTFFARNGVPFATRVFDLGMMQYALLGGRVHHLGGRTSALFAYRGPGDRLLVCQMYEGSVADLPKADEQRELGSFVFLVYRKGNLTVVFWQEGDTMCVLTSDAPYEAVIQLAAAKAMKA